MKIDRLCAANIELSCCDFQQLEIPDGSMVYLDPPYKNRAKQSNNNAFNRDLYYIWARKLAMRCTVIATEFVNPYGWQVLYDYGDTVVRHWGGKGKDGTRELLLRVRGYEKGVPLKGRLSVVKSVSSGRTAR